MPEKPLEATFKRYNKKVYVTLYHRPCNTVVEIGTFPESAPMRAMSGWITRKNELFPLEHPCALLANTGVLPMHSSADARLFGG